MNTYTIRALSPADAIRVRLAAEALASYTSREGLTQDGRHSGTWDLKQAAKLATHLESMLELVEQITRP